MAEPEYIPRVAGNGNVSLKSASTPLHVPAPVDLDALLADPEILSRLPAPTEGEMCSIGFLADLADRCFKLPEHQRAEKIAALKDHMLQLLYGREEPRQRYHNEAIVLALYHCNLINAPECAVRQRCYGNRRLFLEKAGLVRSKQDGTITLSA